MKMYFRILLMQLLLIPSLYCGKIYLDSITSSDPELYWIFCRSGGERFHFLGINTGSILLHEFYTREEAEKLFTGERKKRMRKLMVSI